jgi:hypothetical protein
VTRGRELELALLPDEYAACRLAPDAPLPAWAEGDGFCSVTRTADELSVICRQERVPEAVEAVRGWRCLRVTGPLDFGLTGVAAALTAPLAAAEVSVLPVATYDTDYLLVRTDDLPRALAALRSAGHRVG